MIWAGSVVTGKVVGVSLAAATLTAWEPVAERIFLAYQTSFQLQFQTLNRAWMNNADAPETDSEGHDLLVGQGLDGSRFGSIRDSLNNERARITTTASFVIPTGGAFLFSPSLKFFRDLAS